MIRFRFPNSIAFYPKKYISHLLILISILVSIFGFIFPLFVQLFGLHHIGIRMATLPFLLGQVFLYQFFHGGWMHLFFNSYFLYSAGPEIETRMKRKEFLQFFIGGTFFVAVLLWFFAPYSLTIGISGFCMALLSYLYMDLQRIRHPLANQILTMLIINILIGFTGNISFVGHFSGAIWGFFWWYMKKYR